MDSADRRRSRWESPWGQFVYQSAVFLRVVALLCGVVMGAIVVGFLLRVGWSSFLVPACIESAAILAVGFLLQLVPRARNHAVRP